MHIQVRELLARFQKCAWPREEGGEENGSTKQSTGSDSGVEKAGKPRNLNFPTSEVHG